MGIDTLGVLQWNCQGVRGKKDELLELINNYKPDLVALQETKLWKIKKFEITEFNFVREDGHFNRTPHGGVRILIHSDTLSGRIGKVVASHAAVARSIPLRCTDLYYSRGTHGVLPMRVGGVTSQLDLQSLMPLSIAGCG